MLTQILLVSGAYPRYFAGFGCTKSGTPTVMATAQLFHAKHFNQFDAGRVLETLKPSWPLAQVSFQIDTGSAEVFQ